MSAEKKPSKAQTADLSGDAPDDKTMDDKTMDDKTTATQNRIDFNDPHADGHVAAEAALGYAAAGKD